MEKELGKWYVVNEGDESCMYILRVERFDNTRAYGKEHYFIDGATVDVEDNGVMIEEIKIATSSQIEQCLIAYARKNGYVEGIKFYNVNTGSTIRNLIAPLKYNDYTDTLYCKDGNVIYYQGRWADIVQDPKEVELPEDLKKPYFLDPKQHAIEFHEWAENYKRKNFLFTFTTEALYEQFIKSK